MIAPDEAVFPNNVVILLETAFQGIDPDLSVFKRPLRPTDPVQSIGIVAQLWDPDEESVEMRGMFSPGPSQPTLQRYLLGVQAFVKDGDEVRGLAAHSVLSNRVRGVLYRGEGLRLALQGLSATDSSGATERLQRWGIRTQRYFANEIESEWLYLSTLEFWIETEMN